MEYDNKRHHPHFNKSTDKEQILHFKCREARGTGWLSMNGLSLKTERIKDVTKKLQNLTHLYLSGCSMKGTIPSFEHLVKLQVLDLSDNAFNTIHTQALLMNINLVVIDISINKLSRFPTGICCRFKFLRELNLAQNDLVALPEDLSHCPRLEMLDVSYNLLRTIPESICNGPVRSILKVFRLRNNVLAYLPENIGGLTSLEELDLRENDLSSLPRSSVSLNQLQVFHHKGNRWTLPPIKGKYGYKEELLDSSYGSQALRSLYELMDEAPSQRTFEQIESGEKSSRKSESSGSDSLHIESLC